MIEGPGSAGGPLGLREGGVQIRINVEADCAGLPFDRVEMKIVREILAGREAEGRSGVAGSADRARTVERTVNDARLLADIFHDVDFAARGPADGSDVVAEHPEGGPHSLPSGYFYAGFEATVGLAEEALGFEASGGVIPRCAATPSICTLMDRVNDQCAAHH